MSELSDIKNFILLKEIYATSGQPTAEQFRLIAKHGYKTIINLGMPDHPHAIKQEDEIVAALNMNYIHIPVDFSCPTPDQVSLFCNLLAQTKPEKVYVHCIMNFRVAAFMFHYLNKVLGYSRVDAMSPIFDSWEVGPVWQDVMQWSKEELGLTL